MEDLMVSGDASFSSVSASGNITAGGAFYSGINGLYINNKKAIFTDSATDNWLRINGNINFSSGVYFGNSVVRTDRELQVGSGGAYLKSNSTNTTIAKLSSPSGTITDLSSTTGSITTLSSSTINADNVNVRDTLRSKKWEIQVVQTTGDQMIAPMIYFQQGATVVTGAVTTTSVPITITDSNIGTNPTWGGATWYRGSKVKVSGKIGNVVLGVTNATISANMGSTSNKLQLTMEFDNSKNVFSSNTTYTSDSLSAMMYQINTTPNAETPTLRPIGIYMTAYGENRNSSISIYGGTNGSSNEDPYKNPNVRVGLLNGLSQDYNIDGTAPSGWGIATTNGWFKGTIHSSSGIIGGWTIGDNNLFSGDLGTGIWLATANTPTNVSIGGSGTINTWRITSGSKFGVTSDGSMYCSSGKIAGWTIDATSLSNGTFGSANSIFLIPAGSTTSKQIGGSDSISNWVISVGNTFGVTKAGVLYATGANISGVINATTGTFGGSSGFTIDTGKIYSGSHSSYNTAANGVYIGTDYISLGSGGAIYFKNDGTGKIGPWNITASSIYKGTSESFYTSGVMYFGNSGLSLGNTFKVTSAGVLTAASGAIGGISMNNSYGLYTNSKTAVNSTKTGFLISKSGAIYLGAYDSNTQACPFQVTADGALTSTSGKIGSWNINATSIYKGNETMGTAGSGNMYFGDSGLSISNTFSVTSAGVLSATGATINGTLTAGADSVIGPWNVTANSIYIGNSTMGANGSNAYLGTSGISVSDGFKVTSSGKLTVKTEYRIQGTKPNDDTESVDNDFPIIRGNGYKVNDNKYWRSINIASVFLSNTPITNGGPTDTTSTLPQVGMTISQYTGQSTAETRYGYIRQSADYYDIGGITLSNGSQAYAEDMSILSKSFGVYTGSSTSSFQVLTTRVNINDSDVYINSNKFITAGSYKVNMCNLHISPGLASPNGGLSTAVTLPANSRYLFVVFHNSTSALCGIYLISTDSSSISVATIVSAANISFSNSGLSFRYKNAHTSSTANGRMIYMGS